MGNQNNTWGDALDKLVAFKQSNIFTRSAATPFLINTGRLVELDPDGEVMEVYIFEGGEISGHLFIDNKAIVALADDPKKIAYTFQVDDKGGGKQTRKLQYRGRTLTHVMVDAMQKENENAWKQLGGTTKGGIVLTYAEWEKVIQFARLQHTYKLEYNARNKV